jgi:hypothetical protein
MPQGTSFCTAVPGKGGGSGAGLWRCGQSRHSCARVTECVLLYLAKRRRIRGWIVEVWPEPAQLHRVSEYVLLYLVKRKRIRSWIVEVWPEPAQLHQGIRVCSASPGKKEADRELECGGVARAGTAAPGCQSVYCCTWQKGGGSGAGLWRCGQSRHSCIRVSECVPLYLAK